MSEHNNSNNFNDSYRQEHEYIVGKYSKEHGPKIREQLAKWYGDNTITHSTHEEIYKLIENKLGLKKEK